MGLAAALLGAGQARAAAIEVDYGIWLSGLPLGQAGMKGEFDGTRYKLQLQVKLTGFAGAITGGQGSATAAGAVTGPRPNPSAFAVTARSASDQRVIRMGLAGGNVVAVEIEPPWQERPDRVPVSEAHKRAVIDPLSAVLMPSAGRGPLLDQANCNRTVPVFDGATRFDVVLTYGGTRTLEKGAYAGPVLVCQVRYVPISGHRANGPATRFMAENRDISVWLAPVESARLLVPVRISVRTTLGTSLIEATRWRIDDAKVIPTAGEGARNPNLR
jgi:hypothetical protein